MDEKDNHAANQESVFNNTFGCDVCDNSGIKYWLNCNSNDAGFHIFNEEEIIDDI